MTDDGNPVLVLPDGPHWGCWCPPCRWMGDARGTFDEALADRADHHREKHALVSR